jgi:hypothetical protein
MKTVRMLDSEDRETTHWSTCRHDRCLGHDCPRYNRCCGGVAEQ